ncbi:ABC-2 type transport system permease protein [Herbihabitans rhizosphaerae]|uniref:ABC-2 type transport system permease protein n=1 Tax=Herbihabitans rhizosphaerae TaxID=1872711 RepID=A0A4Q7KFW6_9PSEU|nr:ABC transporter permease subunit [Herbihabitans rhizosphaerae]RZS32793.1 ABC-2 type transport system permease protein [Herbihabitans rhizosphaerae]
MGRLINAEFRKILTTKMWWGLMIPTFIVALAMAWGVGALTSDIADDVYREDFIKSAGIGKDSVSFGVIALTRAINISTMFPLIFGALALSSELHRKTITTSFLTASSRPALLSAKAITYVLWGAIYGIVIVLGASLGTLAGSDSDILPEGGQWMLIALMGIVSTVLWTLLGLGVGALMGSPVASVIVLLIYAIIVGPVSEIVLTGFADGKPNIAGALPNGSANGLTGSTAADLIQKQIEELAQGKPISDRAVDTFQAAMRFAAGAPGAFALWASALIFIGWSMLFFVSGLARNQRRDIT